MELKLHCLSEWSELSKIVRTLEFANFTKAQKSAERVGDPKMRHVTVFAALVIASILQGCSAGSSKLNQSESVLAVRNNSSSSGGNGEYYGGKPTPGLYVRALPDLKCGGKADNLGEIRITDTKAEAKLVNPQDCSVTQQTLSLTAFEFASYDTGRVGHIEGIYTKVAKAIGSSGSSGSGSSGSSNGSSGSSSGGSSNGASPTVEEMWCRKEGSTQRTGFDVVIKADYKNRRFQAFVVSAKVDAKGQVVRETYSALNVRRDVELNEKVRYRADDFELDIRTKTFNPTLGTMNGEFKYDLNGQSADMYLLCRLGGELDVKSLTRPFDISMLLQPKELIKTVVKAFGFKATASKRPT